jgi:hypothetical protein
MFVAAVGPATGFDPAIGLGCHVAAVWAAFAYEWVLWHRRTKLVAFGRSLGLDCEEMAEAGSAFTTTESRRE